MNKKILFGLMAVSILTVGLLIWSCGDDGKTTPPSVTIELTGPATTCCPGVTVTLTATVTKGEAPQEGKVVDFEITSKPTDSEAILSATSGTTDAEGITTVLLDVGTGEGDIVVEATVEGKSGPATIMVSGVYVEDLYDEPAFRMNITIPNSDMLCGQFELLCELPPIETNLIFTIIGLETIDGTHDVVGAMVDGLCGAPAGPATTSCTGTKTDFFISPTSYDENGCVENYFPGSITDGDFYSEIPEITLATGFAGETLSFSLFDLVVEGDVNETMTIFSGTISGATIESGLVSGSIFAFGSLGWFDDVPGVDCAAIRDVLGDPDVDLDGGGIPDCEDTPLIKWCWCEKDAEVLCASEMPLSAECVAQCISEGGMQDCKETAEDYAPDDPMYIGSEDGFTSYLLFEASKVTLFPLPEE